MHFLTTGHTVWPHRGPRATGRANLCAPYGHTICVAITQGMHFDNSIIVGSHDMSFEHSACLVGTTIPNAIRGHDQIASPADLKVESIGNINIDDSYAESPHAIFKRQQDNCRRSSYALNASRCRLGENLRLCRTLPSMLGADLHCFWQNYNTILRTTGHAYEHGKCCDTLSRTCNPFE